MRYPDRSSHRVFNLTRNRNRKKTIYPGFIGFLTNQQKHPIPYGRRQARWVNGGPDLLSMASLFLPRGHGKLLAGKKIGLIRG